MEIKVWHNTDEKQGTVLALTDEAAYRYEFRGKLAKKETAEAVNALLGGQNPASLLSRGGRVIPLSSIQRVEVSHGRDTVKFFARDGETPVKVEFTVKSGDDGPALAREVVTRAGIAHPERSEDIGVVEALLGPVLLGVIVGVLWSLVYSTATTLDAGEEFDADKGSFRGRGFKRLIGFIAGILGTKGSIAVGVVLLLLFLFWAGTMIVKRPQRLVWGPPTE